MLITPRFAFCFQNDMSCRNQTKAETFSIPDMACQHTDMPIGIMRPCPLMSRFAYWFTKRYKNHKKLTNWGKSDYKDCN